MSGTSERLGAVVSVRSMNGQSVFDPNGPIDAANVSGFTSTLADARSVADTLVDQGFEITNFHPLAISFSGLPKQFKDVFGVRLHLSNKPGGRGRSMMVHTPDPDDTPRLRDLTRVFGDRAEGVAIACPPRLIDDAGLPVRELAHDDASMRCLPDELAASIWGDGLARIDATGDGIVAASISTGHYRHHFFDERRYRVLPTLLGPGQTASTQDEHGHGTGEAACLFATAPNLRFRPIKGLLDPVGDILMTIASLPTPDLLINSWGYDVDHHSWDQLRAEDLNLHNYLRLVEVAIAEATIQGVVVLAATPRTWRSFPASHPDVLSIGSAISDRKPSTDSQVSVTSHLYPNQSMPEFWSRVGDTDDPASCPGHLDFALPTQPLSGLQRMGRATQPTNQESWSLGNIDQAAFPFAAGIVALQLERYRGWPPHAVKALMTKATAELTKQEGAGFGGLSLQLDVEGRARALAVNDDVAALAAS